MQIYHIKCIWVSDLHFMVQWFCLISWRLFDGGMLYWRYWFSATLSLTYKYICNSVTYILWYIDSALYFQYYLMNKPHSLDIGSDMGHWSVFHDLAILNHLPISAYSGLLKFDMKIYCECSKVRNRPAVCSRHEAGASVYFGHIFSLWIQFRENALLFNNKDYLRNKMM